MAAALRRRCEGSARGNGEQVEGAGGKVSRMIDRHTLPPRAV